MAQSIEMRQYLRKYTLDDAKMGLTSIKMAVGPSVNGRSCSSVSRSEFTSMGNPRRSGPRGKTFPSCARVTIYRLARIAAGSTS